MTSAEAIATPGPARDIWARAAVVERFRAGDLLGLWLAEHPGATGPDRRDARRAVLSVQEAARPALDADGGDALRLPTARRLTVLQNLGPEEVRHHLEVVGKAGWTEGEALLAGLINGDRLEPELSRREQLANLFQVAEVARALGVALPFDPAQVQDRIDRLDFLQMIGGPDLPRFVGRRRELEALARAWSSGRSRTVLVQGPGGMGKSLLVCRFIADLLESDADRPDAVFHLDFDRRHLRTARPAIVMAELVRQARRWVSREVSHDLDRLAEAETAGVGALQDLANTLVALIGRGRPACRILVFVDNTERAFGIDKLVAHSPGRVADALVTAGARVMQIYSGRAFPAGFEAGRPTSVITLPELSRPEATALLGTLAGPGRPQPDRALIEDLLGTVGRSPLALRIASSLLEVGSDPLDVAWDQGLKALGDQVRNTLRDRVREIP